MVLKDLCVIVITKSEQDNADSLGDFMKEEITPQISPIVGLMDEQWDVISSFMKSQVPFHVVDRECHM